MNKHLVIVCTLPTALFLTGAFLSYVGFKCHRKTGDRAMYNVGAIFMVGAIIIALQAMRSL